VTSTPTSSPLECLTLKMKAQEPLETPGTTQPTIQRNIPQYSNLSHYL
jgi:hypothetical protein